MSETVTVAQAAKRLGISRWLAYEQAKSGAIAGVPVIRIGATYRVPTHLLDQLLTTGKVAS